MNAFCKWTLGFFVAFSSLSAAEIRSISVPTPDGLRQVLVASPKPSRTSERPLVLLFHGHVGSAKHSLGLGLGDGSPMAEWLPLVDRENLVVVALDGAKGPDHQQGWNDGRPGNSGNPSTDDVAYTRLAIRAIQHDEHIDTTRIYAMGMSNGGIFLFRLGQELDIRLAALCAASANFPGDRPPVAVTPISVLLIAGTDDPLVPYNGGQVKFRQHAKGPVLGVDATLSLYRMANHLTGTPDSAMLSHRDPSDPTYLERLTWGASSGGPQVELLRVRGGGHAEPSISHRYGWLYRKLCGFQNRDIESVEEAWSFFKNKRTTLAPKASP